MKSNFKYIVTFIIGSLSIVFLVQLFWLKGLYNTIEAEAENTVMECLMIANVHELESRLDSIDKNTDPEKQKSEISISQSIGHTKNEKEESTENKNSTLNKRIVQKGDTIKNVKEEGHDGLSLAQMEQMSTMIKEVLHQALDSIAPIRLDTLYSSLSNSFTAKGIKSEIYRVDMVNLSNDSIIRSVNPSGNLASGKIFDYTYNSEYNMGYRIYIEPLTKTVLTQMLGILSTTFLIILILGFSFWYLIKTILQQKTLEEMKEDFTNNMTHELKTPIAVAYSATDALLNFGLGDNKEKRDQYLTVCKDQLEKLSGLVEQILSMSMERRLKFILKKENILIKDMLMVLADQHRMKAEKDIVINIDIQPDDLVIYADRTHLNNIISNLIDNAIKYSKENINIDIKAYNKDGYQIIVVKDNGIGIAPDKLSFLFEKFYRIPQGNKHNAKGYGIGLFYVKSMVEEHGGSVSVSSIVNKGSTFTLKLPVE